MLQAAEFMPHGMCLLWRPELMALHIISDALIAAAYFAIPFGIFVFMRARPDLNDQHRALALLFAVFIAACGCTHVMAIVVLWKPYYVAEGLLKALTAAVSVITALALPFLIPQLLRIPSPKVLEAEIAAHRKTLSELRIARTQLADRVEETEGDLRETNRRFQAALRDSPVTVFEQDAELRYTWVYNPPLGLDPSALIGHTELDFFDPESAQAVQTLKLEALEARQPRRQDLRIAAGERSGWFDLRIEPIELRNGQPGLVATSTDVTDMKRHEEHLKLVMRELNHRSKNLLTIVLSIARRTARGFDLPDDFLKRLEERLTSLASAHDVLAMQNWRGADLLAVIRGQLKVQLQTFSDRITLDGPPCMLPAEAAHYVGMALHELGSNAVKHGVLAGDQGTVAIRWSLSGARDLHLEWCEEGGPKVQAPSRQGFGSTILQTLAPRAIGGEAELVFEEAGLRWTLRASLPLDAGGDSEGGGNYSGDDSAFSSAAI